MDSVSGVRPRRVRNGRVSAWVCVWSFRVPGVGDGGRRRAGHRFAWLAQGMRTCDLCVYSRRAFRRTQRESDTAGAVCVAISCPVMWVYSRVMLCRVMTCRVRSSHLVACVVALAVTMRRKSCLSLTCLYSAFGFVGSSCFFFNMFV